MFLVRHRTLTVIAANVFRTGTTLGAMFGCVAAYEDSLASEWWTRLRTYVWLILVQISRRF